MWGEIPVKNSRSDLQVNLQIRTDYIIILLSNIYLRQSRDRKL